MIDWNLIFLILVTIPSTIFLSLYAYKSPARFIKLYGIKDECCKTAFAIQMINPYNTTEYMDMSKEYDFDDINYKNPYYQCIHCKRIFVYKDVRTILPLKGSVKT